MVSNKSAKKERIPWTREEILRLIAVADNERDRFMIIFLWQTGCRKNELFNLRLSWVRNVKTASQPYGYLVVPERPDYKPISEDRRGANVDRTKPAVYRGAKSAERRIPISKTLHEALTAWFKAGDREFGKYPNYPNIILTRLAKKAGINKYIIPHSLRHTFVQDAYNAGMRIQYIKTILGHSDEKMINTVYLHIDDEDAAESANQCGLLER